MRANKEYIICKQIATYMRLQYPDVMFHFDLAGLNLSKAQAGMMKAIQGGRGWPDFFIARPKIDENEYGEEMYYYGLFLEIKVDGTKLWKAKGGPVNDHIKEQIDCLNKLNEKGYMAEFAIGFNDAKKQIDDYLR